MVIAIRLSSDYEAVEKRLRSDRQVLALTCAVTAKLSRGDSDEIEQ
jgi:hypothetical protein